MKNDAALSPRSSWVGLFAIGVVHFCACTSSKSAEEIDASGTGGAVGMGGISGTDGMRATGGSTGTGGRMDAGDSGPATGGISVDGAYTAGGNAASGGYSGSGGVVSSGGATLADGSISSDEGGDDEGSRDGGGMDRSANGSPDGPLNVDAPQSTADSGTGNANGGYVCVSGIGLMLPTGTPPGGMPPIGTLTATINGTKTILPICPGFGRCQASSGSMTVTGAIDTGESVSINVYEPAAGSFAANNTTGSSNGLTVTLAGGAAINCSDIPGADGIINVSMFTASTGGTISGTFSGTVSECSPAVGGGAAVSLVDGSFSCQANE